MNEGGSDLIAELCGSIREKKKKKNSLAAYYILVRVGIIPG